MSEWTERFQNHPLHTEIGEVESLLKSTEELVRPDPRALVAHARVQQALNLLKTRLDLVDPVLVPVSVLNGAASQLGAVKQQLQQAVTSSTPGHLVNAANATDALLATIAPLAVLVAPAEVDGVRESLSALRRSVGEHQQDQNNRIATSEKQLAQLEGQLVALSQQVAQKLSELQTGLTEFENQFSLEQTQRAQKFSEEIDSRNQDSTATTSQQAEQFKASEEARRQEFQKVVAASQTSVSELLENTDTAAKELVAKTSTETYEVLAEIRLKSSELMDQLERHRNKAEELVNIVASTGMSGGYQKVANQEGIRANRWHYLGVTGLVGLVGFAIYGFVATLETDISWAAIGARFFAAASFALFAAYSMRQADKHREQERWSRRLELVLASMNPYLAELPESRQAELRESIAKVVFSPHTASKERKSEPTVALLLEMCKEILERVPKV